MNALKRIARLVERLWAPVLLLVFVLACGLFVTATDALPEVRPALSSALAFGPVI